jgi:2-polyprenyl-3-methyl-5-hydroxy-6-metoxy-1,4-benzoquinol methylase
METLNACPVCDGRDWSHVTDRGLDFDFESIQACRGCGTFFQSPRMDAAELATYYEAEYSARYRGSERPDRAALAYRDGIARYRFEVLSARGVLPPGGTLLEAGCGAGNFLRLCRDHGLEVWGVEPSRGYAETAVADGLRVTVGSVPGDHGELDRYHAVALFHVLEHLSDPRSVLRDVGRLLAPGGALLLEVPDLARALGPRWSERYFHRPHLFDFTAESLRRLLAMTGFRVEHEDYCTVQRRRRHHLLVVARRDEDTTGTAAAPAAGAATDRLVRRVRRRLRIARRLAPIYRGLRRLAGGRG